MASQATSQSHLQRRTIRTTLVRPVKVCHGVLWLEHVFGGSQQRESPFWSSIDLLDVLPVRDQDNGIIWGIYRERRTIRLGPELAEYFV